MRSRNEFQKIVETNITHDGVFNIRDGIIAHTTTQNEHLQQLRNVFDKIREKVLKRNLKKCEFCKSSVNYMGHNLSSEGLFPEPEKVNVILNMKPPSNKSEVRSFLGLVTCCSKFVRNFATITEPLRRLTPQKADFIWNGEQETAFSKIKTFISKLQYCRIFIRRLKPKLLLTSACKVWVLFCFEKALQIAFFNQ